ACRSHLVKRRSVMTFDASDPRLTAYALGELDGSERAEIEAHLAGSAEAARFVDEIRETARLLTEQLRLEPSPGLAAAQREVIEINLRTQPTARRFPRWIPLALAAILVAGATTAFWVANQAEQAQRELAMADAATAQVAARAGVDAKIVPVPL